MIPILARRGKLVLASGSAFVLVGALHSAAPLVALGGVILIALLSAYLWFFPTAIMLRRKKIELSWWVPPGDQPGGALAVERPFALHVAFRNHSAQRLRVLSMQVFATSALEPPKGMEALVPRGQQVMVVGEMRAHAAGYHVLHGAVLVFGDILGLFDVRAFFPNPLAMKVFPRQLDVRAQAFRPKGGSLHEQMGQSHVRRRGLAGDLREIRDHTLGDSFKYIAWKATARRRKLMVKDLETEIVVTHQILVDIGSTMRAGAPGQSKLDYAIETATALARTALDAGDRVGLITFDSRVYSELRPGAGHHHLLQLIDRLIEVQSVVDDDLTDVTTSELCATVAGYLAQQEALDVRVHKAPPMDDPRWERIQTGPRGELYDLAAMAKVIEALLATMGDARSHKSSAPAWWWSHVHVSADTDPVLAKLRLFCRLRGIELPYRSQPEAGARSQGLLDAAQRVASHGRADMIVVISDLGGLARHPERTMQSLARARRHGQRVLAIAPFGPAFATAPRSAAAKLVGEVLRRDERDTFEEARRLFTRNGIPVIEATPQDSPAILIDKIGRARSSMRRVA